MLRTVIIGTGSYIPTVVKPNLHFTDASFYNEQQQLIDKPSADVVLQLKQITGIAERRYLDLGLNASDMGVSAASMAIADSKIPPETIDQLIVAHNFGNVWSSTIQSDAVPSLASRIKNGLQIKNPLCVAYDILFGCPGWLQGVIQADAFFKAGLAKQALVIGTESLSRVTDAYDRDSMIYSDGAGAAVLAYTEVNEADGPGILSTAAQTHAVEELEYINMGKSYHPNSDNHVRFIKMQGRKVYEFALKQVPLAMKDCLDKSGIPIENLKKIFIHQANEKMDEAIVKRLYKLYGILQPPATILPMSIHWLGNSSVATIPTLYDLVCRRQLEGHHLQKGDIVLFASVGAGMNINAVCYRC
jgi:3-oxoacyl-[acyl-carrier-protein] synthase III